jgi:hypothetical protein
LNPDVPAADSYLLGADMIVNRAVFFQVLRPVHVVCLPVPGRSVLQPFGFSVQAGFVELLLGVPEDYSCLGNGVDVLRLNK